MSSTISVAELQHCLLAIASQPTPLDDDDAVLSKLGTIRAWVKQASLLPDNSIEELLTMNGIETLVGLVRRENQTPSIVLECVKLLSKCARCESLANEIRFHGGQREFVRLLGSSDEEICEMASKALTSLSALYKIWPLVQKITFSTVSPSEDPPPFDPVTLWIRQAKYSRTALGWKVWPASIILSNFIFWNRSLFENRDVLELGSGCGLSGLMASLFARSVVLSDYNEELLHVLQRNIKMNRLHSGIPTLFSNIDVVLLDWYKTTPESAPNRKFDVIILSDGFFEPSTGEAVARTLALLLRPGGHFYIVSPVPPAPRMGVEPFMKHILTVDDGRFSSCDWTPAPQQYLHGASDPLDPFTYYLFTCCSHACDVSAT